MLKAAFQVLDQSPLRSIRLLTGKFPQRLGDGNKLLLTRDDPREFL